VRYFAALSRDFGQHFDTNVAVSKGVSNTTPGSCPDQRHRVCDYSGLAFVNDTIFVAVGRQLGTRHRASQSRRAVSGTDIYFDRIALKNQTITGPRRRPQRGLRGQQHAQRSNRADHDGDVLKLVATDPSAASCSSRPEDRPRLPRARLPGVHRRPSRVGQPLVVKAGKSVPTIVGQLTADASFAIDLDGAGPERPSRHRAPGRHGVAARAERNISTSSRRPEVDRHGARGDKIKVGSAGGKLLFTRVDGSPNTAFRSRPEPTAGELGLLSTLTSDEADLVITTRSGATTRSCSTA